MAETQHIQPRPTAGNPAPDVSTAPFAGLVELAAATVNSRLDPSPRAEARRNYMRYVRACAAERAARREVLA